EVDAVHLDQRVAFVADVIAVGIDQLPHRTLEAVARGIELADAAPAPEEIEAVVVLEREAVDTLDEMALGHVLVRTGGGAAGGPIEPGLAPDPALHDREREVVGPVGLDPADLGRPELGDAATEVVAHVLPLPDEAAILPGFQVARPPQLHPALGPVIAVAVERADEVVITVVAQRDRGVAHRLAGDERAAC